MLVNFDLSETIADSKSSERNSSSSHTAPADEIEEEITRGVEINVRDEAVPLSKLEEEIQQLEAKEARLARITTYGAEASLDIRKKVSGSFTCPFLHPA